MRRGKLYPDSLETVPIHPFVYISVCQWHELTSISINIVSILKLSPRLTPEYYIICNRIPKTL